MQSVVTSKFPEICAEKAIVKINIKADADAKIFFNNPTPIQQIVLNLLELKS